MTNDRASALSGFITIVLLVGLVALGIVFPVLIQAAFALILLVGVLATLVYGGLWLVANLWALFSGYYPVWWK